MLARKPRASRPPLPIPAEDLAKMEQLRAEALRLNGSDAYRAACNRLWEFQRQVWERTNRCVQCGNARRGRRLCRDCYRA